MSNNDNTPDCVFSIVVPMYNEAENIDKFYERIINVMENIGESFEIVCINDGSKDDTFARLIQLHEKTAGLK